MVEEDVPGVDAHGGAFTGSHFKRLQRGEAVEDLLHTKPRDEKQGQEQDDAAGQDVLSAGAAQQHHEDENAELDAKTYNAPAGRGQEKSADGQKRENGDEVPALFADLAEYERHQRDGHNQLGESGEVIAIDVRAKGDAAVAHLAEPIELTVEGDLLQDAEDGDEETENHDEPDEAAPIVRVAEGLGGEEQEDGVGEEKTQVHAGVVDGSGGAQQEVEQHRPEGEEEAGGDFEDGLGPVLDAAMSENGEGNKHADADAEQPHGFGLAEDSGTSATSSIHAVP